MKKFIADTNFYLRFLLRDVESQAKKTEVRLKEAKAGKIKILFTDEVILEMGFVLKSNYLIERGKIAEELLRLVKTTYLEIENRNLWVTALSKYAETKISLLDVFLFTKANQDGYEVLSYDEDFQKLQKIVRDQE